jgi:hypothetical protein
MLIHVWFVQNVEESVRLHALPFMAHFIELRKFFL